VFARTALLITNAIYAVATPALQRTERTCQPFWPCVWSLRRTGGGPSGADETAKAASRDRLEGSLGTLQGGVRLTLVCTGWNKKVARGCVLWLRSLSSGWSLRVLWVRRSALVYSFYWIVS